MGAASSSNAASTSRREAVPFDVFFEDWSRLFEVRGFIVDQVRMTDYDARPVSYMLFLGGEEEHAKLDTVRLDIFLQRVQWHRFSVGEDVGHDVPNPRAQR